MAESSLSKPLTRESVQKAHELIKPYVHLTPVVTSTTLDSIASAPQEAGALKGTPWEGQAPAQPKFRFFFKCENYQKVGAFKARGAFHALLNLSTDELSKGVTTHSSGNHAQALALAARTKGVTAHIVMPTISTPSKIAGTKSYGANVIFSGSTEPERVEVVNKVIKETGATLVPPYDHPDILLGQGTMALELEEQAKEIMSQRTGLHTGGTLDAVIAPLGGGGMLSGIATALSGTGIRVFGAEPSFQGADDGRRGLAEDPPRRIESVKTLTIADGLRTPVGKITWTVISDKGKVQGVYSVTEDQIKAAMKLVLERMKVFVEPSACVGLAVCLFDEDFRRIVEREGGEKGWNVSVIFSGGNTTVEAIGKLFATDEKKAEREEGTIGMNGEKVAENIAG